MDGAIGGNVKVVDLAYYRLTRECVDFREPIVNSPKWNWPAIEAAFHRTLNKCAVDADGYLVAAFKDTYFRRNRDPSDIDYVEDF